MKRISIIKRLFVIALIFLLSINTFAVAVSDNDGASFITRPEFDTLKAQFQSQLDGFNTSIDSSIDTAVTNYFVNLDPESEKILIHTTSDIEYPLSLYMKNVICNPANFAALDDACKWWTPKYLLYAVWDRGSRWAVPLLSVGQEPKMDVFYFGEKQTWRIGGTDTDVFYLNKKMVKNYRSYVNGVFNLHSWADTNIQDMTCGILMDQSASNNKGGQHEWTRGNLLANYGIVCRFPTLDDTNKKDNTSIPLWFGLPFNNKTITTFSFRTVGTKYDTMSAGAYGSDGIVEATQFMYTGYNQVYSNSSYDNSGINRIFVLGANSNDRVAPVVYNEKLGSALSNKPSIYVTNSHPAKRNHITARQGYTAYCANGADTAALGTLSISCCIDAGLMLEPEGYGSTTRKWYNRSLINPDHIWYDVTLNSTNQTVHQKMTDGFIVTDIPRGAEMQYGILNINVNWPTTSTEKRYIMFSTGPIESRVITTAPSKGYLKCGKSSILTSMSNYIELERGQNRIYFDKVDAGSYIYMKILWTSTDTSITTINEQPTIRYYGK